MKFATVGFATPQSVSSGDDYVEIREELVEALDNPSPLVLVLGTGVTLLGLGALYWYMTSEEVVEETPTETTTAVVTTTVAPTTPPVQETAIAESKTRLRKPTNKTKNKKQGKAKGKTKKKSQEED